MVIDFIESGIINHFGCSLSLVCNNGPAFASLKFSNWYFDHGIIIKFASNYYPQGNGLAESSNKNLLTVIRKLLEKNPKDWHTQLRFALWEDRTRKKTSIGTSPYHLVYGLEPIFPIQLRIPTLQFINEYYDEGNRRETRLQEILHLEERRDEALEKFTKHQVVVKRWFDKRSKVKAFRIYDLVLYWDKAHDHKGEHGKFDKVWLGPYQILEILEDNAFRLKTLTGEDIPLPVNGQYLKHYFQS